MIGATVVVGAAVVVGGAAVVEIGAVVVGTHVGGPSLHFLEPEGSGHAN